MQSGKQTTPTWEDESLEPEIQVAAVVKSLQGDEGGERAVVGERFGKYLIVGELAVGGMAEVFLAVQRGLEGFQKVVVIKRVLPHLSGNPDFIRMFVDEARLAARLEHPNIVRTYEFGEVEGQYFTAMEYLPGEDLSKALNSLAISRQKMPVHIAAGLISNLCAGLHCAHELTDTTGRPLNLVHRDVNPANIILTYNGEVKVIDFGVAKTNANQATMTGTIKGKIAYMSPEQLLARGVDQRSDVFSTGVVLWEVLTGRPLFMRDSEAATLYAIMNDPIPPPSRYRPDLPKELDEIALRALSRTPADRFDSAAEMAEALDAWLASQATHYDTKVLAKLVEELFGSTRAEAKRSIAQTRSLQRNISLVMKLRTEVRSDLAETLDSLAAGTVPSRIEQIIDEPASKLPFVIGLVILAALGAGVFFLLQGGGKSETPVAVKQAVQQATLEVDSTPPGAAISIGGEPTGLKTPATLTGLTTKDVTIRLELPNHAPLTESLSLVMGDTLKKQFTLAPASAGRLVVAGLPRGASVVVDGNEYEAGQVIELPGGAHEVKVLHEGRTITQQTVETAAGDHNWKLVDDKLVKQ